MRILIFSARNHHHRLELSAANRRDGHRLRFVEARLSAGMLPLASAYEAICTFVNDRLDALALRRLAGGGTRLIRCAAPDSTRWTCASPSAGPRDYGPAVVLARVCSFQPPPSAL